MSGCRSLMLVLAALAAAALSVTTLSARADGVPKPQFQKPKGKHCVEPNSVMLRYHMKFLLHHRDETVHEGIRTRKFALTNCLSCHVRREANGQYPKVTDKKFFCTSCHTYAAVKIDCFECHASHPESGGPTATAGADIPADPALHARDLRSMAVSNAAGGRIP